MLSTIKLFNCGYRLCEDQEMGNISCLWSWKEVLCLIFFSTVRFFRCPLLREIVFGHYHCTVTKRRHVIIIQNRWFRTKTRSSFDITPKKVPSRVEFTLLRSLWQAVDRHIDCRSAKVFVDKLSNSIYGYVQAHSKREMCRMGAFAKRQKFHIQSNVSFQNRKNKTVDYFSDIVK